jgi:hypothetical protein
VNSTAASIIDKVIEQGRQQILRVDVPIGGHQGVKAGLDFRHGVLVVPEGVVAVECNQFDGRG